MISSSRVVRLVDVRSTPTNLLWNLFTHACSQNKIATPTPMLAHSDSGSANTLSGGIWAVFSTHEDARAALNLGCDIFSVSPALESDLAMHPSLRRLNFDHAEREVPPRLAGGFLPPLTIPDTSRDIYSTGGPRSPFHNAPPGPNMYNEPPYTISSNPPNPKTSFRAGDWMCSAPNCSAHNFQRNISCIVCGRPRSGGAPPLSIDVVHPPNYPLANPSPRFAPRYNGIQSAPQTPLTTLPSPSPSSNFNFNGPASAGPHPPMHGQLPSKAPPPQYPPLTPSGRSLSVGGRVRNVSRDPLAPCVMYWPDNEPTPEPCQIRPVDSALMTFPPIINTGNKGAAEKQPGDWLCGKCNYHNWRRRKVCQTCFPYAEGNGDSISAAVQAERIALLANVLATQFNALEIDGLPASSPSAPPSQQQQQSNNAPPFQVRMNAGMGMGMHGPNDAFLRRDSRDSSPNSDHFPLLPPLSLAQQEHEHEKDALPIYQTSGGRSATHPGIAQRGIGMSMHAPRFASGPLMTSSPVATRTLLPSFLQDIVHSPSLSPSSASSSSADLSFDGSSEDAHYASSSGTSAHSHSHAHAQAHGLTHPAVGQQQQQQQQTLYGTSAHNASNSSFHSLAGRNNANVPSSIWRLDGEESRTLSGPSPTTSGPSSAGPTPAPYNRPSPPHAPSTATANVHVYAGVKSPGGSSTTTTTSPRTSDATPKSTNDFWQVRYN
ncbi:uncharacterized protein TRAVEDRAFT_30050 [Trametes versicolor FP-101664 SS1]|uniref:uncharacterized protein n=1 Tax=Trametes versicolor (strain FP-101664) TaxID=717944 RepID=UPI000462337E|nr:uncharacterized protein TRAVEDRAFT_30050 [Trametes versicolor FP-101664 SS1]EIW56565.1 hypothetical protein TRAVEDRAFT_30050 [Trametes versicolor FP-101664 SS1]